jgi:hypothetical protein
MHTCSRETTAKRRRQSMPRSGSNIRKTQETKMKNLSTVLLAGALTLASTQAHVADGPGCAVVMKTPDGFLNLRAEITTSARIITKLLPGDRLYVKISEAGISGVGDWAEVDGVWRLDSNNSSKPRHSGWVARRFIRQIKCPAEMQGSQENKRERDMPRSSPQHLHASASSGRIGNSLF